MSQHSKADTVEEARLLLPWYITGKLSNAERELVERMLSQNAELRADYERECKMVGVIRTNASLLELTTLDSTQMRLDKLMRRIEHSEAPKTAVAPPPPVTAPAFTHKLQQWLRQYLPDLQWLTPANAVFASLLILQVGFAAWFFQAKAATETVYVSATANDQPTAVSVSKGMKLLVEFNNSAQVQELRDFLLKWNAHITDGPDANNLFHLEVRDIPAEDQRSEMILQQMQQDQTVVLFAGKVFP